MIVFVLLDVNFFENLNEMVWKTRPSVLITADPGTSPRILRCILEDLSM